MKIDLHTHILPRDWPDLEQRYGYAGWIKLDHHKAGCARMMSGDRFFREIGDNSWDPLRRIEDCDRCGVDVQVLSTVPIMFSYWAEPRDTADLARMLNDHVAGFVAEHPKRFVGLGTLPMQDADLAVRELERCMTPGVRGGLGLAGVQIGTNVNGRNLNEPEFFPIFAAAERLGAAVFVHPWDMMGRDDMRRYWLPWLVGMPAETCRAICSMMFGGVFERLPKLRVAFAHGGGSFGGTIGRIIHGFECRPDLVAIDSKVHPRDYLARSGEADGTTRPGRFYFDSLVHDADALRAIIRLIGAERIALGSDYPFPLGEAEPGRLIESMSDLNATLREQMFAGTATEFLGREVAPD
jgi:aminocarboxymuconate-semialdehyde decarboxylase